MAIIKQLKGNDKMKNKEQIRAIMPDVKGEFVKDKFIKDTYLQARQHNGQNIYYVIPHWQEKVAKGKVDFIDIDNGEGAIFVALNY